MIKAMTPNGRMINVVSQANNEVVPFGNGGYFDNWNSRFHNQVSQQGDVQVQRGASGIGRWLPGVEHVTRLVE